jgi:hypothetical protein
MSAMMNALREEGTKADVLVQLERMIEERDRLSAQLAEARKVIGAVAYGYGAIPQWVSSARALLAKLD